MTRVAVIGAGLIGKERVAALSSLAQEGRSVQTVGIFDANVEISNKLAAEYSTTALPSVEALLELRPDWVMIALPHDATVQMAKRALDSGSSVLIEKPMGRDLAEAEELLRIGADRLRVGLNYRFCRGISQAIRDLKAGRFGEVISVEMLLGHGCAPGQEKTWKLNDDRAGGGCLIDPGIHLLDLCLQMAPDVAPLGGISWDGFWKTGIEEEVSLVLKTPGFAINVRISIVAWRSEFLMRINGTEGYGIVTGRNRSYGGQKYVVGPRWGWRNAASQVASEHEVLVDDGNEVFKWEIESLLFGHPDDPAWPKCATAREGLEVMKLVDNCREILGLRRNYAG
jgi:predicted dehydrogenase